VQSKQITTIFEKWIDAEFFTGKKICLTVRFMYKKTSVIVFRSILDGDGRNLFIANCIETACVLSFLTFFFVSAFFIATLLI